MLIPLSASNTKIHQVMVMDEILVRDCAPTIARIPPSLFNYETKYPQDFIDA